MTEEQALAHRQTWEQIPWVVNGTATADDRQRVEAHLDTCADCRDEFALQSQLHAGINVESAASRSPQPGLQRLLARIDAEADDDAESRPHPSQSIGVSRGTRLGARWVQALVAAVVVQAIGLSLLGTLLLEKSPAGSPNARASYETLSSSLVKSTAAIRLVPAAGLTMEALQGLLADAGLRIVESSGDNAILGLAPVPAAHPGHGEPARPAFDVTATVARLRAHAGVLLAEPVITAVAKD